MNKILVVIAIVLSFVVGVLYYQIETLQRAIELLETEQLHYDSNDMLYIANGSKKQIKK